MSIPADNSAAYPGSNYTVSQLLYAVKRKLEEAALSGRYVRYQQPLRA